MLIELCHLNLISHSSSGFIIKYDASDGREELEAYSKSYSGDCSPFSIFQIISQNDKTYLFTVCRNDTIIQIEIESMKKIKSSIYNYCGLPECDEKVIISALAEVNYGNKNMMWFCTFVLKYGGHDHAVSHCRVPKNSHRREEINWMKEGFASTSNDYMTYTIQVNQYIFIGSYAKNSLTIHRTKFPNEEGKEDYEDDLKIPMTPFYFETNSQFIEAFATEFEVYYVVVEPVRIKSASNSECPSPTDDGTALVTRLVRICKDDFGGLEQDKNFGTTAKSDIICPVGLGTERYQYTRSISASWSGDKLYILFDSQKNSPSGKVLCVYDEIAFKKSLNGEVILRHMYENSQMINKVSKNNFKDLCQNLTKRTLSEFDRYLASTMSINSLYRLKKVMPITSAPLINLRTLPYHSIKTFRLSSVDSTTVIVLIADNSIRVLTHTENSNICFLKDFRFRKNEKINQVKGQSYKSNAFIHISTTERMVQLKLSICEKYTSEQSCLTNASNICGWDSQNEICSMALESLDPNKWWRSECRQPWNDDIWSLPETCNVKNLQGSSRCTCRYCLDKTRCLSRKRVNVTDCFDHEKRETYGIWSPWSECTTESQVQTRSRMCKVTKCKEKTFDSRICKSITVTKTNWTKWYKATNTKYHVSFRVHCPIDELSPATIEEREMLCDETCQDYVSKWSSWSDCVDASVQYRLLNCSSFESCSHTKTEVKGCSSVLQQGKLKQGNMNGEYTIIHVILSILVVSLIWLIILILVIVCIFRYNVQRKKKLKRLSQISKNPARNISTALYLPLFSHQKSVLSDTSNDYFTPEIQLTSSNPMDISSTNTNLTNIYSQIPLPPDRHPLILD